MWTHLSWNRVSLGSGSDKLLAEHKAGTLESPITLCLLKVTPWTPLLHARLPIPVPLQWQLSDQPSQSLSRPLEGKVRVSGCPSTKGSSKNNIFKVRDTGKAALIWTAVQDRGSPGHQIQPLQIGLVLDTSRLYPLTVY